MFDIRTEYFSSFLDDLLDDFIQTKATVEPDHAVDLDDSNVLMNEV